MRFSPVCWVVTIYIIIIAAAIICRRWGGKGRGGQTGKGEKEKNKRSLKGELAFSHSCGGPYWDGIDSRPTGRERTQDTDGGGNWNWVIEIHNSVPKPTAYPPERPLSAHASSPTVISKNADKKPPPPLLLLLYCSGQFFCTNSQSRLVDMCVWKLARCERARWVEGQEGVPACHVQAPQNTECKSGQNLQQ